MSINVKIIYRAAIIGKHKLTAREIPLISFFEICIGGVWLQDLYSKDTRFII